MEMREVSRQMRRRLPKHATMLIRLKAMSGRGGIRVEGRVSGLSELLSLHERAPAQLHSSGASVLFVEGISYG